MDGQKNETEFLFGMSKNRVADWCFVFSRHGEKSHKVLDARKVLQTACYLGNEKKYSNHSVLMPF